MTVDEWQLRDTARSLAALYAELDHAKHAPRPPREVRVMRPRPGPAAPGNWRFIALDRDLVDRLHEFCRDIANHIEPAKIITWDGKELCAWLAFNANAIADLDFADDLHDELQSQERRIIRTLDLDPEEVRKPATRDTFFSERETFRRLRLAGIDVGDSTLRAWASKGLISKGVTEHGKRAYRWGDLADRLGE